MPLPTSPGSTRRMVSLQIIDGIHVGYVAELDYTDENWPEILGVLFNLSMAPDAGKRETAYRVFATTPGIIEKQHESAVMEAFGRGFKDDAVGVCSAPVLHR
jgi:importin-5